MSIGGIESVGFTPFTAPVAGSGSVTLGRSASAAQGPDKAFGDMLVDGLQNLENVTDRADGLAVQAATGDLSNIHDYTIAASEASITTQLTVAVRNRAVEAFNEIMRMQV
ncbi:flagellar hook-basal body complex protein FliE [uncultured Nocardioides sp.]|uniref:flagellar hook-basal body complex protein FliE n=1 Tax=uncultured Nocardioides sp. TaxID=198441 RepID=UPI0025FF0BBC|nr:flagellar hook-basal body complex protein FliE [uncultured Nocardioides sp.]